VDSTRLDLKQYRMDLIVGGEGISEPLPRASVAVFPDGDFLLWRF